MLQRVVQLVTVLSTACRTQVSFRGMAAVASDELAVLYPGASVMVFEHDPGVGTVRAVAGSRIPASWNMRAVRLADLPLLAEALAAPQRLLQSAALHREPVGPGDPLPVGSLHVLCGAIPDPDRPVYALLFFAPPNAQEASEREAAVEITRRMLAAAAASNECSAERQRTIAAIVDAKREWQLTVDALPRLVGIIDARHRIVRVNRAVERWGLGDVRGTLRRDLHAMLHRDCADPECALKQRLVATIGSLATSGSVSIEAVDPRTGRELSVELVPATHAPGDAGSKRAYASFSISDVTASRHAEAELKALNQALEQRVEARTGELTAANRTLREEVTRRGEIERDLLASQRELEALSGRLIRAQEDERQRIAQDLHDSIGQSLSAVKYTLERAQVLIRRQEGADATSAIAATVTRIQRIIGEVRGISMNLRPAVLDDLGAASAVRFLCREWRDVYQDVALETDIAVDDEEIPPLLGTNVFRAVQESLNNIARHANARRVEVSIRVTDGTLAVIVRDDGTGFALNGDVRRLIDRPEMRGLRGLRERASQSGGRCDVSSSPGQGTTVRLEWPVSGTVAAREANALLN